MSQQSKHTDDDSVRSEEERQIPSDGQDACALTHERSTSGMHNKDLGRRGEEAAARFLERRGMEILERNWTCLAGEADLIAKEDDEVLHFVEVKTRSNIEKGFPSEAVTQQKRERYERIALDYLAQCEVSEVSVMFDIISIVATGNNRAFLRYHRNAFSSCE